ncbi:uncharacterized protein LOC122391604 [Amphibalanus amphitrite]|uniref:uncharacterized protein LOC122391604 n=1 Tax=Amphibalanus amphitrite TaxID=1232801 RepID=UPI001C920F17|nr:uncharacterized protein LOC122391604 [Amphibalanus amphitrite]
MMKVAFGLLALVCAAVAAPAPQFGRRPVFGGASSRGRPSVNNVSAQVTNVNQNRPDTLSFNGGLALASSNSVGAFGTNIAVNHAQAISQNIAIPVPQGFNAVSNNRFNNRNFG